MIPTTALLIGGKVGIGGNDSYTKLLLHFDNDFVDSSTSNYTANTATGTLSTTQSKFGGYSVFFDGTTTMAYTDSAGSGFDLTSGDFTVDCWIYPTGLSSIFTQITARGGASATSYRLFLTVNGTGYSVNCTITDSSAGSIMNFTSATSYSFNAWHHIALVRNGSNFDLYWDGTSINSATSSSNLHSQTGFVISRATNSLANSYKFKGYIDEFRISKGIARWTANFTPPTEAYST